jgi:hypothetical protein
MHLCRCGAHYDRRRTFGSLDMGMSLAAQNRKSFTNIVTFADGSKLVYYGWNEKLIGRLDILGGVYDIHFGAERFLKQLLAEHGINPTRAYDANDEDVTIDW